MIGKKDFSTAIEECVARWPALKNQLEVYYSHLNFIDFEAFEQICSRFVEDFRSMPLPKDFKDAYIEWRKDNLRHDPEDSAPGEDKYQIHFKANCQTCTSRNIPCIEEPLGSKYRCRQCYTGLTSKEIQAKYAQIIKTMEQKKYDVRTAEPDQDTGLSRSQGNVSSL